MDKLTILILNDFDYINGGASQVALMSAKQLSEFGHSVTLFSAVSSRLSHSISDKVRSLCTHQYEIISDPSRIRAGLQGLWNFKSARELQKELNDLDPSKTIVHVHSWNKALSSSVIRKALSNRFKVILTAHDYSLACPNGGFFLYPPQKICTIRPLSIQCVTTNCDARSYTHKLWRVGRQWVQRSIGEVPNGIKNFIFVSQTSRRIMEPFLPKASQAYYVRNPIDVPKGEPSDVASNHSFTFVGRLSPEKGPVLFAKSARRLQIEPVFLGDGECRSLVIEAHPSARIEGWLPQKDALKQMRLARALVFPSLWYETQGLVVLEAAAFGVPSIISDSCVAKDFIVNGETGLLFKSGSEEDLADKIKMLQSAKLAKKMGQAAYDRYWADPTTLEGHAKKLEEVYWKVLVS